jgi:hypothetical protein
MDALTGRLLECHYGLGGEVQLSVEIIPVRVCEACRN